MKIIQSYAANFTAAAVAIESPNKIKSRVCVCVCGNVVSMMEGGKQAGEGEELG